MNLQRRQLEVKSHLVKKIQGKCNNNGCRKVKNINNYNNTASFIDFKASLSNIYRSLVEGGDFAAAVWASPDKVPFISVPMNTVMKETNSPPPPPGTPGPFSLSDENSLKNSYLTSGFKNPIIEKTNVSFDFDSPMFLQLL